MTHPVIRRMLNQKWPVDFWNARLVETRSEELCVRRKVVQPTKQARDDGIMLTVVHEGGIGYAATSDLSDEGLSRAFEHASSWARQSAHKLAFSSDLFPRANPDLSCPDLSCQRRLASSLEGTNLDASLRWHDKSGARWHDKDKLALLKKSSEIMSCDSRIVDNEASLSFSEVTQHFASSAGALIEQEFRYIVPVLSATAHEKGVTQFRTLNGRGLARQAGFELFESLNFNQQAAQVRDEAIELLSAENCPEGRMDLVLMPDQMMLQIHESIGHPLELDRILGDERNYAGTSFVTLDMFGSYQYGSPLLNITFDPSVEGEFASFAVDDEGNMAQKEYLIAGGILKRPLGGLLSQARAKMSGTANGRACNWNRPPIDRMANLNLEPGASRLEEIISSVDNGVLMRANISWSIDDSRNKFQFGCEYGQVIKNGRLTKTVRNPNYRGVSATFWRNLKMVGDKSTLEMYGTRFCGKGEPNQAIRVGHASPACLFSDVEVFGGEVS